MDGEDGKQSQPCTTLVSTPPPGLAPTDRPPPPGFQKPFNQNPVTPLSTLQGNKPPGPSLGSLASEHLKTQPSLGLENLMPGSLVALSLQSSKSDNAEGGRMKESSLGSLARNHLDGYCGGLVPSLTSLTVNPSASNGDESLGSLAANHLSGLKILGSSPSLGSLAASHLSSDQTASQDNISKTSSPSLESLASTHLRGFNQAGSKSSLGSLASNHLSETGSKSSLGSLAANHLSSTPTGPSLGSLAASHLSNQSLGSPFSKSSVASKAEPVKVVDLTSALKPNSLEPATPAMPVLKKGMVQAQMKEKLNVSLLVHDLSFAPRTLQKRRASSFGHVVSRKWRRLEDRQPLKIKLPSHQHLPVFVFDTPSPDDIVKSAQAQSRAFRPPTTAAS